MFDSIVALEANPPPMITVAPLIPPIQIVKRDDVFSRRLGLHFRELQLFDDHDNKRLEALKNTVENYEELIPLCIHPRSPSIVFVLQVSNQCQLNHLHCH